MITKLDQQGNTTIMVINDNPWNIEFQRKEKVAEATTWKEEEACKVLYPHGLAHIATVDDNRNNGKRWKKIPPQIDMKDIPLKEKEVRTLNSLRSLRTFRPPSGR